MNHSPINDPGFKKIREEARRKASQKRRAKTLTMLIISTLLALCCTSLLCSAAFEAAPDFLAFIEDINKKPTPTLPPLPPVTSGSSPILSEVPSDAPSDTPSVPLPSDQPTESEEPSIDPDDPNFHVTTIYIDAGHGFTNSKGSLDAGTGAGSPYHTLSGGLYEKDLNLQIALKVQALLEAKDYRVIMSRTSDVYEHLTITQRAERVVASSADCCVSIHANASDYASAAGTRIIYCNKVSSPSVRYQFARDVAAAIDARPSLSSRSVQIYEDHDNGGLVMCNSTGKVPSILVETCFLTNQSDAEKAVDEAWQNAMAEAIVDGIVKNFPWSMQYID